MAHAEAAARVATDAGTLWQEVGSFQHAGESHPMLTRVEGEGERPGAIRTAHTEAGQQVERLLDVDSKQHWQRYRMESTPLPVDSYTAELRVVGEDTDVSTVRWIADFEVTSGSEENAVAMVQGFLQAGVSELADRYGGRH